MSVINKMLRDLDSRQPVATAPVPKPQAPVGIARGTQVVADNAGAVRKTRQLVPAAMLLALLMTMSALAAWWYLNQVKVPAESPQHPQGQVSSAAVEVAAVPQPLPSLALPETEPKPVESVPAPMPVAVVQPVLKPDSASPNASLTSERTLNVGIPIQSSAPRDSSGAAMPLVPDKAVAVGGRDSVSGSPVPSVATTPVMPRLSPGLEALALAQNLWASGKNDAAIDVLQEALSHAERSSGGGPQPAKNGVLVPIARELARMKLAEGRVGDTLDMLTRLETSLSDVADVWALRGHAAQRLGRHQEAVAAYLRALALRPEEARWKLGAAISLAAQNQITAAADLAQEAQSAGAASPEVIQYLRQLGVLLLER